MCDFLSVLLLMFLRPTVLPFASAEENKHVLSWAMGDTLTAPYGTGEGPWKAISKDNQVSRPILITSYMSSEVSQRV